MEMNKLKILISCVVLVFLAGCGHQDHHYEKGEVIEVRDGNAYTHIRLKTDSGHVYSVLAYHSSWFVGDIGYRDCSFKGDTRYCFESISRSPKNGYSYAQIQVIRLNRKLEEGYE